MDSQVRRRRRDESMCSCRRRSSTSDDTPGWTCTGDQIVVDKDYVAPPPPPPDSLRIGYPETTTEKGYGHWCSVKEAESAWNLKTCPGDGTFRVKALTYNLFWWNLFGRRGGEGGRAGKKISSNAKTEAFDVMAFQECDDVWRVLGDAGMSDDYSTHSWGSNTIAYRKARWAQVASGITRTSEDRPGLYGRRGVHWVRLWDKEVNKTLFFLNHHGPLPVGSGGICGGTASAYNILKVVGENSYQGDHVVLTGDFNANPETSYVRTLEGRIYRVFTGTKMGGIDHFFSNCGEANVIETRNLGSGGSDHDALMAIFAF